MVAPRSAGRASDFPCTGEGGSALERQLFEVCKARWPEAITNGPDDSLAKAVEIVTGEIVCGILGKVYNAKVTENIEGKRSEVQDGGDVEESDVQTTA